MDPHAQEKRYLLEIDLDGISPAIRREVIVPESIRLSWLHEVIQEAMGWMDCHLHQFEHEGKTYGVPDMDEWSDVADESSVALNQLFKRAGSKLTYTYDLGDDWRHSIRLKKVLPPDPQQLLHCVSGERACPPEDCGGIFGYMDLCELRDAHAKGKKLNQEEQEQLEWFENLGDEDTFEAGDLKVVNETFKRILDLTLPKGGLGLAGADASGGVFKAFEFDEEDEEDFDNFLEALSGEGPQTHMDGLVDDGDDSEDEAFSEPYADMSTRDKALFRAALDQANALRAYEPWKVLYDSDLFGIEDPETGDITIASVLGANKEVFALHLHRPPQGFDFWRQAFQEPNGMSPDSILLKSSIIEVEFRNKKDLEEPDLQLYERLDAPKPGKGSRKWALFRNYRPRAMPWFPKPDHLPLLLRGMQLTMRYLDLMAASPEPDDFLLSNLAEGTLPKRLRVFQLRQGQDPDHPKSWALNDLPIDWESCGTKESPYLPSEFEVQQLANLPRTPIHWELGAIHFPNPVMTEDGPVIPLLAVALDTSLEAPPIPYMTGDLDVSPTQAIWNCLKERALESGGLPNEIHVSTDAAEATLAELRKTAGIQVIRQEQMELLNSLFQSMSDLSPDEPPL